MSPPHAQPAPLATVRASYWLLAARPKTLSIAVAPVLVAHALAWSDQGTISPALLGAILAAALLIQIGTNLHNDAADHERGVDDPAHRLGPPRATSQGWLEAYQVRRAAWLCFALSGALGSALVIVGGWPVLAVGLCSIAAGLAYTGGSRPISFTALGELFVLVFFGLVAVATSYYLQTGIWSPTSLAAGAVVGLPAAAVLAVNNYRDVDGDRRAGRRTLAVSLGRTKSRYAYAVLLLSPFALLPTLASGSCTPCDWLPWIAFPWAGLLIRRFWLEHPGPGFNTLLASTARFQLVLSLLLSAAFLSIGALST